MFKRTNIILATALAIGIALSPLSSIAGPRDTFTVALAERVLPSTVTITAKDMADDTSIGSGFIIDRSGLVLTNEHVIAGAVTIKVKLYGDKEYSEASLVFADPGNDLAVLRIKSSRKAYPELGLGPSSDLKVGEPAIAIGSPLGEEFTVTQGIISKLHVLLPFDESGSLVRRHPSRLKTARFRSTWRGYGQRLPPRSVTCSTTLRKRSTTWIATWYCCRAGPAGSRRQSICSPTSSR